MTVSVLIAMLLTTSPAISDEISPTPPAEGVENRTDITTPEPLHLPDILAPRPPLPSLPASANSDDQPAPSPSDDDGIVVMARPRAPREDPLQAVNLQTYAAVQVADKLVVAPAAHAYSKILPAFFRLGVRHFFSNLNEPVVFLNFLLQHKVGKAFETVGRFGVNSTIGAAGLVDVAKRRPFNLPFRRNGFANTMGFYGVKSGPFLFLPLVGPTTVRDLLGLWVDKLVLPVSVGTPFNKPWYTLPSTIIQNLDYREQFDAQLRKQREAPNPYAASRAAYLESRQAEIDALHVHRHDPGKMLEQR